MPKLRAVAMAGAIAGVLVLCALGTGRSAFGSEPGGGPEVPGVVSAADATRRPLLCTPFGCRQAPSAAWTFAAGFGLAVGTAAWLGRRRRA